MWYETPTELNRIFFSSLEKYCELTRPTGDKIFDAYVKKFYRKNLSQRREELVKKMRTLAWQHSLLSNFKSNITDYELRVSEHNWGYQSEEERNKNMYIYNFLCDNLNSVTRKITMSKLVNEYKECKNEVIAIERLKENPSYKKHIENLKMADMFYSSLSRSFVNYLKAHPNTEFAKKYNLSFRNFDRQFFDTHIEDIKKLNPELNQEK